MKLPSLFLSVVLFLVLSTPPQADQTGSDGTRRLLSKLDTSSIAASRDTAIASQISSLKRLASGNGSIKVIVGLRVPFAPEGLLSETDKTAQRRDIKASAEKLSRMLRTQELTNPESVRSYESLPFVAMEVTAAELERLARDSDVISIVEDKQNRTNLLQSVPLVGAPAAWSSGYSGKGQVVAVLDTGIDGAHPFLRGKVVSEACFSGAGNPRNSFCPGAVLQSTGVGSGRPCPRSFRGCDHGTHVAGIVAGSNSSFSGVAKDANLISIQVFSKNRRSITAWDSDIIFALQRISELSSDYAIAAVNMSLGRGGYDYACDQSENPAMTAAIETLKSRGIATIVSSGNDNYANSIAFPACISSAVSVGATWDAGGDTYCGRRNRSTVDQVACFSNSASFLTLLAPGARINSSVPGIRFSRFVGTSMAAPHVAAAFAILKEKVPFASVDAAQNALTGTGVNVIDQRNGITKPRLNIPAALNALSSDPRSTISLLKETLSVNESVGYVEVPLVRSSSGGATTVHFTVTDLTTSAEDVSVRGGLISFADGETAATITIWLNDDEMLESDEQFSVSLMTAYQGAVGRPLGTATVTILDDDAFTAVNFSSATYSVSESAEMLRIPLTRPASSSPAAGRFFVKEGTAGYVSDYRLLSGNVSFQPGETTAYLDIPIINDSVKENNETFEIAIFAPRRGSPYDSPRRATVTIVDDD